MLRPCPAGHILPQLVAGRTLSSAVDHVSATILFVYVRDQSVFLGISEHIGLPAREWQRVHKLDINFRKLF